MKKLLIFAFTLLCFTSAAMAEIGLGLRLGGGQDDNNFESEIPSLNYSFTETNALVRLADISSELGEVSKEVLKARGLCLALMTLQSSLIPRVPD